MTRAKPTVEELVKLFGNFVFTMSSEESLQVGLHQVLQSAGYDVRREHILGARDRVDFLVGDIGIEVKMNGPASALIRQLERYTAYDAVRELLVVTTRLQHASVPRQLGGKRVDVVVLVGSLL